MHGATVIPRMPATFAPRCASVSLVLAAVTCLALAACSPGGDYPTIFPSAHDIPPRTDTPLNSNQVQQATEDLISARDRLSVEAQDPPGKSSTGSAAKPAANSSVKSPANSAANAAGKSSSKSSGKSSDKSSEKSSAKPVPGPVVARKQPSTPVSAPQTLGTDAQQTPGTETK